MNEDLIKALKERGLYPSFPFGEFKDSACFDVRDVLIEDIQVYLRGGEARSLGKGKEKPAKPHPLLEELLSIDGIVAISVVPYQFAIRKAELFSWDELAMPICNAWETYKLKAKFDVEGI